MSPDFTLAHHGTIAQLTPLTDAAEDWAIEHLPKDAPAWGRNGYVIGHQFLRPILEGINAAGLFVSANGLEVRA